MTHIRTAIEKLSLTPRAEGETAFPALAAVLEAVRGVIRASKPSEEQASANRYLRYVEAAKAEGVSKPDEEMQAAIDKMSAKFGFEKKKFIDTTPVLLCCPHCSQELPIAPNIRFWEPEELEALAGTMRSNRALAAANRAASLAAQASPLNEVTA
jgi:hypothetical protein